MIFDVEVTLVMEAFAEHPDAVWPGQLGVDQDGQPVLLDCNCVPTCQCCCPDGSEKDQCGFCTQPPAIPPCICTADLQAQGRCIPCPVEATSQPDAVPVCMYLAGTGNLFQRVDVPRCDVQDFFLQNPGSVFPGFDGLDCWCQTPTPPPLPPCLHVYDGCPGSTVLYQSIMCLPLPNSTLSGLISCASASMLEAYSCPFGCQSGCALDPTVFDVLGLSRFTSPVLGTDGVCGALPGLPNSLVRCIPNVCIPVTTLPITTTTTTTGPPTVVPSPTAAPTPAPTTPTLPDACLTASPGCVNGTMGNVARIDGVLCAVGFREGIPFGFRMTCDTAGSLKAYACASLDCSAGCERDELWEQFLGIQGVTVPPQGVCLMTNIQIPGVGTTSSFLTCKPCFEPTVPPTAPPLTLPPNQVPPIYNRTNPPTTTSPSPYTATTQGIVITTAPTPGTTSAPTPGTTSSSGGGGLTTTTPLSGNNATTSAAATSTTTPPPARAPVTNDNANQNPDTNSINLLAVVGVPMAALAATVVYALGQQGRPEAPKYYPQPW